TEANATRAGNDVVIATAHGDLTIGSITAPDAVTLTATTGAIKDDANNATVIRANSLSMTAGTAIGAAGANNEIDTDITSLTLAQANNGSVFVGEQDTLSADGLTVTAATATGAGNDVVITTAHGDLTIGSITAPDAVTLTATTGAIKDDANNATVIRANSLSMTAGTAIGAAGANNEIDTHITTLTVAQANNGSIFLREQDTTTADGLVVSAATATGAGNDIVITTAQGDLTVGAITAPDTVLLTANLGSIKDDGNNATIITADAAGLQAQTGINGLRTALKKLEAQTVTGGISLNNSGNLDIGGVSGTLTGVRVITSGGIQLVNDGTVSIKLPGENVVAPGDVSIVANGATSDIVTGGSDGFPFGAVRSTAGTATLNAG